MNQQATIEINKPKFKSEKAALNTTRFFAYLFLVIMTLLCLFPFYILIVNCTRSSSEIQQGFSWWFGKSLATNWKNLTSNKNLPVFKAFGNSLLIAFSTATLTVYFSALTAYAVHIYNFKGKKAITTFIIAIMMIPTQVASLGLVLMCMRLNLKNNFLPIILPGIASPITFFYMKQYLETSLPYEIVEAARVDGSSELRIFHTIVLPILKPALAVQFIFSFVNSWNNYFIPAMLITSLNKKTLPLIIAGLRASSPDTFDMGQVYLLMTIAVIPLLVVYLFFSRYIIKGLTSGAVKG